MKIHLVTSASYDDFRVCGAFSTRAAAVAYMNHDALNALLKAHPTATLIAANGVHLNCPRESDFNEIEEIELDSLPDVQWRHGTYAELYGNESPSCSDFPTEFIGRAEQFDEEVK